jgi:hypothetical protein
VHHIELRIPAGTAHLRREIGALYTLEENGIRPTLYLDLEVMAHAVIGSLDDARSRDHFIRATTGTHQRRRHQPLVC